MWVSSYRTGMISLSKRDGTTPPFAIALIFAIETRSALADNGRKSIAGRKVLFTKAFNHLHRYKHTNTRTKQKHKHTQTHRSTHKQTQKHTHTYTHTLSCTHTITYTHRQTRTQESLDTS